MPDEFKPDARFPGVRIHESAYVDEPVRIGEGTTVWHFCHLLGDVSIGSGCSIGQNVMIGPRVTVGNGCKVQNNVSLYEGVVLEDDVFCGPSCVFTNVVNPRAHVSRKSEFKRTLVRRGATIGANATILCGHELGAYCFIAAGAVRDRRCRVFCADGGRTGPPHRLDEQDRRAAGARSRLPARWRALPRSRRWRAARDDRLMNSTDRTQLAKSIRASQVASLTKGVLHGADIEIKSVRPLLGSRAELSGLRRRGECDDRSVCARGDSGAARAVALRHQHLYRGRQPSLWPLRSH